MAPTFRKILSPWFLLSGNVLLNTPYVLCMSQSDGLGNIEDGALDSTSQPSPAGFIEDKYGAHCRKPFVSFSEEVHMA